MSEMRSEIQIEEEEEGEENHSKIQNLAEIPSTPLPWKQLCIICMMRISEPINFTVIFPFISDFLWDLHTTKDRTKLGLYAGIIESLFAVCQTCTVLAWARASDRYGRRPIIINGLIGSSISSILFGSSKYFPMLVFSRCLSGSLNGNVAVYKAILAEICDRTNSARGFSVLSLTWSLGCIIGPLLGGYLSKPSEKYPIFSTKQHGILAFGGLWEHFPYLLPCFLAACFSWISIFLGTFFLNETLPSKIAQQTTSSTDTIPVVAQGEEEGEEGVNERSTLLRRRSTVSIRSYNSLLSLPATAANENNHVTTHTTVPPVFETDVNISVWKILEIQQIRKQLMSASLLALTMISIDAVNILYFWEPIKIGGLSFPSQITGSFFSLTGIWGVLMLLIIFPSIQKRLGTLTLYRICIAGLVFVPIIMPFANFIAKNGLLDPLKGGNRQGEFEQDVDQIAQKFVMTIVGVGLILKTTCAMAYSCNSIMINQAAAFANGIPLATLNALAQISFSCMNAFGPYTFSTLYAITLEHNWLGGHLIWFIIILIALFGSLFSLGLFDIEKMVDRGEISVDAVNRRS